MREAIKNALQSNIVTLLKATLFGFSAHFNHMAVLVIISLSSTRQESRQSFSLFFRLESSFELLRTFVKTFR